jgi:hypothetical protein
MKPDAARNIRRDAGPHSRGSIGLLCFRAILSRNKNLFVPAVAWEMNFKIIKENEE